MLRRGLLALATLIAPPVAAQVQPPSSAATEALRIGDNARALTLLDAEVAACSPVPGDGGRCLLVMLMRTHAASRGGRLALGEAHAREALAAARVHLTSDSIDLPLFLDALAVVLERQGRFGDAEAPAREALAITSKHVVAGDADLIVRLSRLGMLIDYQGRHEEAEQHLRAAVAATDAALRRRSPEIVAVTFNNLATNLDNQRRWAEAEPLLREALAIAAASLPPGHSSIVLAQGNLAANLARQGKVAVATQIYRAIVALLERTPGASQATLAATYNNLALALGDQGALDQSEQAYRAALKIAAAVLPASHPFLVRTRGNLAASLNAQRRHGEAAAMFEETLADWARYPAGNAERIGGFAGFAATLLILNRDVPRARTLFRDAAAGAIARMRQPTGYSRLAAAELRDSRWIFRGQVVAAWRLAAR